MFDVQVVPVLRYFDARGGFVRQVGREGQGPGEYLDAVLGMAIRSDGRLQLWDARDRRVTIYEEDGSFSRQWMVPSGLFTSQALFVDERDHTYIKVLEERPRPDEAWKIGLLHFGPDGGLIDTIPDPPVADPPDRVGGALDPDKEWTLGPDGSMIVGVSSSYRFEIRRPGGRVVRVERQYDPLRVTDGEWAAYEARRKYSIRTQGQFMTAIPEETPRVKPAYRGLFTDDHGRVWVRLYAPVEDDPDYVPAEEGEGPAWPFVEPRVFDVFELDGTYLGEVHVPADVDVHRFGLNALWGVRTGDLGEDYVVRMRLRPIESDRG